MDQRTAYLWESFGQMAGGLALAQEVLERLVPLLPDEAARGDGYLAQDALRRVMAKAEGVRDALAIQAEAEKNGGIQ